MKRTIISACMLLVLAGCGDQGEKKAQSKLEAAREALARGDYSAAKLEIDSIKILYPKAFEARKEGIGLLQKIELQEQEHGLVYLDSMLAVKQKELEAIEGNFVFEKDAEYQDAGNYFAPSQTVEKNLNRTFLRAQASQTGEMTLTSVYSGASNIHHTAVKVMAPDGNFAQTPPSKDSYESTDLGVKTEKADYKLGDDGSVIGFISLNRDKPLKAEFIGDRRYTIQIPESDRKAIASVYELSRLLASIEQIRKEIKEADLKIEFIKRKMAE